MARKAKRWLIGFGRFGFAAKGIVYTVIGVLAIQTALGVGGETAGSRGALAQIGQAPFGRILLMALAFGIAGYALWRYLQAFADTENKGSGAGGLAVRAGYFIIASLHVGLAASAFSLIAGLDEGGQDNTPGWTARLMAQPFGAWLVGLVGALVVGYAGAQFYRAWSLRFRKKLLLSEMSPTEDTWTCRIGRMGYAARGVAFGIVGVFLIVAAVQTDPDEARGLDGALAVLAQQPWGWAVLSAVAVGLIAYGLYMFVQARYRRMVID